MLTTLSLEVVDDPVTIGPADGVHLEISDGTKLAVAVLKPAALPLGAGLPTDTRAWIGVKATDVGASLEGIDGLVLSLTGGSFSYNSASGFHDSNGGLATDGDDHERGRAGLGGGVGDGAGGRDADDRSRR